MAGDIKQKIVLEGEKEYSSALKEAQRNLRVLRSELKAETAELGKNATEQEKAQAKAKNLQKQIAEQEKVVRTYEQALEEVRKKYGDNEEAVAQWEIKLNNARTALANMRNGLDEVDQGFRNMGTDANTAVTATKSVADAIGNLSAAGEAVSGAIENIFTGMVSMVKSAVSELWTMITETAAKANNWTDLASYYGSTASEMQEWDTAITAAAGDFQKFISLVNQLSFGGKGDKIAEWFGVSDENYTNNIEYTLAVLDAMKKARDEWGTGGKYDDAMADIFGVKRSADVNWFISNLDTIRQKRSEMTENGFLMDEEELATMSDVLVMVNTIEEKWDALKRKFAAGLGTTVLGIETNVSGALDALARFFDAETDEEAQAALDDFAREIEAAFDKVAKAIEVGIQKLGEVADRLKNSDNKIAQSLGNILSGIVRALEWLSEPGHIETVISVLEALASCWAVGKLISFAGSIASLVTNLKAIGLMSTMSGAGSAASGAGAAAGAAGAGSLLVGAGYLAVAVMMVGPTIAKLFGGNGHESQEDIELRKRVQKGMFDDGGATVKAALEAKGVTQQDTLRYGLQRIFYVTGDTTDFELRHSAREEQRAIIDSTNGIVIPHGGIRATEEQRQAAERLWDMWRSMDVVGETQVQKAWDNFKAMFSGDQQTFDRLVDMMGELYGHLSSQGVDMHKDWQDLPAEWWSDPSGSSGLQKELNNFGNLPAEIAAAAKSGTAAGDSNIQVVLDGQAVGMLISPYVNQNIAKYIDY